MVTYLNDPLMRRDVTPWPNARYIDSNRNFYLKVHRANPLPSFIAGPYPYNIDGLQVPRVAAADTSHSKWRWGSSKNRQWFNGNITERYAAGSRS